MNRELGIHDPSTITHSPSTITHSPSIIIIEDDILISRLLEMRLGEYYPDVSVYANGIDGFEAIKKEETDLAILDVMLPGMQGFEILERLKSSPTTSSTKILMLTAKSREEDLNRVFGLQADEYMSKPFDMNELLLRIRKLLY